MRTALTHVLRGMRAELAKTAGPSALWTIWVPLAVVLPIVVTFGIAYVAESFAKIPGQIGVQAATTQNSLYWVIGISVIVLMLAASHAFAAEYRNKTLDILVRAFPRRWPVPVSKWLVHGTIAAATVFALLIVIGVALPHLFPVVYGGGRNGALLYCAAIFTIVFILGTTRKAAR